MTLKTLTLELVELEDLSGEGATIYTLLVREQNKTLFEIFLDENEQQFATEIDNIYARIAEIGEWAGARLNWFKTKEGRPGDGVCALYDDPDKSLRIYCIRFGNCAVILGGGGPKPKDIRALQEDSKLTFENDIVKFVSQEIMLRIKNGELKWIDDGYSLESETGQIIIEYTS
ncbi:MAG: hypothetical protein WEC59_05625 [Salibacteraceae bacterium]